MVYNYYQGVMKDKNRFLIIAITALFAVTVVLAFAGGADAKKKDGDTTVPGHTGLKHDSDENGVPDEGVVVNGHYTSVYAYDDNGEWYWDLGDGRIQGTVDSVEELDPDTLTTCDYVVNHRGSFDNDPFMDSGWIQNHIKCYGYDDNNHYNYLMVHKSDPRYTGNPDNAIWGDWEYIVNTVNGGGNLAKTGPQNHDN